jgi:hypothetical protein
MKITTAIHRELFQLIILTDSYLTLAVRDKQFIRYEEQNRYHQKDQTYY